MYSIASVIDHDNLKFWEELEDRCKVSGLKRTKIPHFSWQTAESYDFVPLREELANICRTERPFKVHTSGLGIFPGENRRIIFLNIVKDRILLDLHEMIWENTILYAQLPNRLYAPENWVPHISLNLIALSDDQFSCAVNELTEKPLDFEFSVSQIGLLYLTLTTSGIDCLYELNNASGRR